MNAAHLSLSSLLLLGCTASPIGDPCVPEVVPDNGFDAREIYLETNSAQCRTSICLVYRLGGDPELLCDAAGNPEGCVTRDALNDQSFCSCRCSTPADGPRDVPLCECGEGYRCDDRAMRRGDPGLRGGYCVPCIEPGNPRSLDVTVFDRCAGALIRS